MPSLETGNLTHEQAHEAKERLVETGDVDPDDVRIIADGSSFVVEADFDAEGLSGTLYVTGTGGS